MITVALLIKNLIFKKKQQDLSQVVNVQIENWFLANLKGSANIAF